LAGRSGFIQMGVSNWVNAILDWTYLDVGVLKPKINILIGCFN